MKSKTLIVFVIIMFSLFFLMLASCSSTLYRSSMVTHVLAVTESGDTLKIPLNQIQPTRIYNVVGYDYYNTRYRNSYYRDLKYYYNGFNNQFNNGVNIYGTSQPNISQPNIVSQNNSNAPNPAKNKTKENN
jgi:hypothetical protein